MGARRRDDRERFLALQREHGLKPLSAGMLEWPDLFRPLADASGKDRGKTAKIVALMPDCVPQPGRGANGWIVE